MRRLSDAEIDGLIVKVDDQRARIAELVDKVANLQLAAGHAINEINDGTAERAREILNAAIADMFDPKWDD